MLVSVIAGKIALTVLPTVAGLYTLHEMSIFFKEGKEEVDVVRSYTIKEFVGREYKCPQ